MYDIRNAYGGYSEGLDNPRLIEDLVRKVFQVESITEEILAKNSVNSFHVQKSAINAQHIRSESIDTRHIRADSVISNHIQSDAITANHIQANAILSKHIQTDAILANHIQSNVILSRHIQSEAITSRHIQANAILAEHIQAGIITAEHLSADFIASDFISAGSITADKLSINTLSSITANLGTVTAGTIRGVDIEGVTITGQSSIKIESPNPSNYVEINYSGSNNLPRFQISSVGTLPLSLSSNDRIILGGINGIYSQSIYDQTNSGASNMVITSDGRIRRSTSSIRYKKDIKEVPFEMALKILNLKPKSWLDKNENSDTRYYGFIAEDFVDAGLEELTVKNEEGIIESYDHRVVSLLVPIVKNLLNRVEVLEQSI